MMAQVIEKTAGDANFHKVWMHHILELVDEVGNQKMRVLLWMLSKADSQNQVLASYSEIAESVGCSRRTVATLMVKLQDANVVTMARRSLWRLNPDVIFKGTGEQRMNVLIKYRDERQADLFEEMPAQQPKLRAV